MQFSILIPVYNVAKYLPDCFESIKKQEYKDFEVIIVDDGSTDGSDELCDCFQEESDFNVTVIHKANQGLISARRVAINLAQGDYCVFLDSDDMLNSSCIQVLHEKLQQYSFPDIILYRFDYYENGKSRECKYERLKENFVYSGDNKKQLYEKMICSTELDSIWSKLIKTDLLRNDKTDYEQYYEYNMSEDLFQSIEPMTVAKTILAIPESLYYYRYNPQSISRCFDYESIKKKNTVHVYQKLLEAFKKWDMNTKDDIEKLDANWLRQIMYLCWKSFEDSASIKSKIEVAKYPWYTLVDKNSVSAMGENKYLSKSEKKLGKNLFLNYSALLLFAFYKKKIHLCFRNKYRKIKRHFCN